MTYKEALSSIMEGKSARRPHWHAGAVIYWHPQFSRLWGNYGDRGYTAFDFDKEAEDWEIVE